jgi:hypothetical protein
MESQAGSARNRIILRKGILAAGVILLVVGVILLPISQVTKTRSVWVPPERVATYQGDGIPHILRVYLEGGNKYRLCLGSSTHSVYGGEYPPSRLEIRDPTDNIIYKYQYQRSGEFVTDVKFQALISGVYEIEWWGYYRDSEWNPVDLIYIEKLSPPREETYQPLEGFLWFGILLVVVGAGICVLAVAIPPRSKTPSISSFGSLGYYVLACCCC